MKKKNLKKVIFSLLTAASLATPIILSSCTYNIYGVEIDAPDLYKDLKAGKIVEIHPIWPYKRKELYEKNEMSDYIDYKLLKQSKKCPSNPKEFCEDMYTYKAVSKKSNLIIKKGLDIVTYSEKQNFVLPSTEFKTNLSDKSSTEFGSHWSHYQYSNVSSNVDYSVKVPLNFDYEVDNISVSVPFEDTGKNKIRHLKSFLNNSATIVVEDYKGNKYSERKIDLNFDKLVFHDSSVGKWYHTFFNVLDFMNPVSAGFDILSALTATAGGTINMLLGKEDQTALLNNRLSYIFGYDINSNKISANNYKNEEVDKLWKKYTKYTKGILKIAVPIDKFKQATELGWQAFHLFRTLAATGSLEKMIIDDMYDTQVSFDDILNNIKSYSFDIKLEKPIFIPYGGKAKIKHDINYEIGSAFKTTPFHWWSNTKFSILPDKAFATFKGKSTSISYNY